MWRSGGSHVYDEAGHAGALPVEVLRVVLALYGRREGRGGGEEKVEQPHEARGVAEKGSSARALRPLKLVGLGGLLHCG